MAFLLSRNMLLTHRLASQTTVARRVATLAPARAAKEAKEEGGAKVVGKGILAQHLAEEKGMNLKEAGDIIESILDDIMLSVAEGHTVTIPGFGSFKRRSRAARKGRNPQTGAELDIPATDSPAFSAGTVFKGVVKTGSWEAYENLVAAQKADAAAKKAAKK